MTVPTITLEQYRAITADARAALRMIREVVEQHAQPGSVPSEEMVEPPFGADINYHVSSQDLPVLQPEQTNLLCGQPSAGRYQDHALGVARLPDGLFCRFSAWDRAIPQFPLSVPRATATAHSYDPSFWHWVR